MKEKKIIILYILMLVVGLALLFTKSTPEPTPVPVAEPGDYMQVQVREEPKRESITIAVAKHDISKTKILTKDDYYFKSIEVDTLANEKSQYISDAIAIDSYVAKNHIAKDTFIENSFVASPNSDDYRLLAVKEGNYMFPFKLEQIDSYLVRNLKVGDLVDLYVFYSDGGSNSNKLVSPSDDFVKNSIKPIIVGKKILYIDQDDEDDSSFQKRSVNQIQLELSNQEIKLLRTLMTNSTIMIYPSTFKNNVEDGLHLLNDKEKDWPLTDKAIFSKNRQINLLKGN